MSEAEESGSVEAGEAIKKEHTDFYPKVEYAQLLSKLNNPQSAYDKLRAIGPY
jgi:hypothetical protein